MDQPVLGAGDILHGQLDFSVHARRPPEQKMRRTLAEAMPPVGVAHGQGVGDGDRTRRRAEGGLQHHGALEVAASHLCGGRGPDRPVASFVTEKATEDRRAVEAREAQPVDRPAPAHQRSAVPIRKERIFGYGGRTHVSSFARTCAGPVIGRAGEASGPRPLWSEIRVISWRYSVFPHPDMVRRKVCWDSQTSSRGGIESLLYRAGKRGERQEMTGRPR